MRNVLFIFGLLLMLFGGGCTLAMGVAFQADPEGFRLYWDDYLFGWVLLGLLPLLSGFYLLFYPRRKNREKDLPPASTPPDEDAKP